MSSPLHSHRNSQSSGANCCQSCSREWARLELERKHLALDQKMLKEEKKNLKKSVKLQKSADTGRQTQLELEIDRLKGDVKRCQQQNQDYVAKLAEVAASHQDKGSMETLKEELATSKQDLQVTQRSLASLFVERDDYKRQHETSQEEINVIKQQLLQAQQEKDAAEKASTIAQSAPVAVPCSTCESNRLRLMALEEELQTANTKITASNNRHEQDKRTWQEKIDAAESAEAANRSSGKEQNLKELLEKYREEVETLREENRQLQRSSFSSHNGSNSGKSQEEVNAAVAVAVATKEDELEQQQREWQTKLEVLQQELLKEQSETKEMRQAQNKWQQEQASLQENLSQIEIVSAKEKESLEYLLREERVKEEQFLQAQREWDEERQSLEGRLLRQRTEWQQEKIALEAVLKQQNGQKEQDEHSAHAALERQLSQKQKEWQHQKESLEKDLQQQNQQMKDWKLLVPRNKALLDQSQAKNESLKSQLDEAREQSRTHANKVKTLQSEVNALHDELEVCRDVDNPSEKGFVDIISPREGSVLIPSDLSHEELMELKMMKKHVIEWEWVNPNGLGGMFTGWLDLQGNPDGHGTLRIEDGSVYVGHWSRGRRCGLGVYSSIDGAVYYGPWENDKFHGRGVYVSDENQVYTGDWSDGLRERKGIESWEHGAVYVGMYRGDKRNGRGRYTYPDGRTYDGEYVDDEPNGSGVQTASDGAVLFDGNWSMGAFLGS